MLGLIFFTLTACLLTVDSDHRITQSVWDEGDVNRMQKGQSDREWVRTAFGEPGTRLSYADGTEIWKYRNRQEKDTEVGLFLIFSVDVEQERVETLAIEFVDGIVDNYWIESDSF
jgi:hypothetical protein